MVPRRRRRSLLGRVWAPVARRLDAIGLEPRTGLVECGRCHSDMVSPIEWHPVDDESWSLHLRCGMCGRARDTVATNAEVADYESALNAHARAMERALAAVAGDNMAGEAERFAEALRRDLIGPGDFARSRGV